MAPKDAKAGGSGFAAARAQLAASAKAANAKAPVNTKKRTYDDDLLDASAWPVPLSDEMKAVAKDVKVSLDSDLDEWLKNEEQIEQADEVLRMLFCGSTSISASLIHPMRPLVSGIAIVRVDIMSNEDGLAEVEPSLVLLGGATAIRSEAQRILVSASAIAEWSPRLILGPASAGSVAGARYVLPRGCWALPESISHSAGELTTFVAEVQRYLTSAGPLQSNEQQLLPPALAMVSRLWSGGGPIESLATFGGPRGATGGTRVDCRGEDGWAARTLSALSYELSQQLLPGLKDGRRAGIVEDLHAPLVKELTRLIGLKEGAPKAPDGKKIAWGAEPSWFDDSILSECACDAAGSEAMLEAIKPLAQLSSVSKLDGGSPIAWLAKWKPRVAPCRGGLRASQLLLDAKRHGAWLVGSGSGGGVGGGGSSVAAANALDSDGLAAAAQGSLWDDAAALFASILVDCLDINGDGHDDPALVSDAAAAIDAAIPIGGGDRLWAERRAPLGASALLRKLLKLLSSLLLEATRYAASSAHSGACAPKELADFHPAGFLAPLLIHALRLCRAPELTDARKRLAWTVATRAASALAAELQKPPDPSVYAPTRTSTAGVAVGDASIASADASAAADAALAVLVDRLREAAPVAETRLNLACCQPLALNADASTGESARLAYIDPEGALATTTGGRFGQEFDDILASFRYDDFSSAAHLRAHVAPTAFDDIAEYDSAFTAVSSHFQALNPKLLKLKPKLGDLAALLFVAVSPKADQTVAAITADLVEALKAEGEADVAAACAVLRASVADTKAWCLAQPKGNEKRSKLEAVERLAAGLVRIAHELAISKSQQRDIIYGRCRVPRFDYGQRISFLDRSTPGKQVWRDATVLHGGPMLCEIDESGKVLAWGGRAEELTGVSSEQARKSEDWVVALLTGMDDMLDHARKVGAGVTSGEAKGGKGEPRLFESVCMPLNTTGGRSMVVAPVIIRPASSGGCTSPMAAAVVFEAGTDIHMLRVDEASSSSPGVAAAAAAGAGAAGGAVGGAAAGAAAGARPQEVRLEPLNHAPLSLPATSFERELATYLLDVQASHSAIRDGLGRQATPVLATLGAPAAAGEEGEPGVLKPSGGGSAGFGFGGGATDWKGAIHAKSLVETAFSQYKSNVLLDDCASRLAIACLVTAPPAHGKSVLIGQLATHAAAMHPKAGALGLVPLVIPASKLGRLLRAHPHRFGSAWNFAEAYSSLVHGAASARHAMLRQLLICRRVLLLVDGIDEGGATTEGNGRSLPTIACHVLEELVLQGHPVVATARSEAVLMMNSGEGGGCESDGAGTARPTSRLWGRRAIAPLSNEQQREVLRLRLGPDGKALESICHTLIDSALTPLSRAAAASPLMLSAVIGVSQRAGGTERPATISALVNAILDAMLSRVDSFERALPPDAPILAAQRALLEALALLAHAKGREARGAVAEDELLSHLEGRAELISAWQLMRRKLARGHLPPLSVLSAKPLVVCLAHPCLQEYLATAAICHGRWPSAMPRPWAWDEWWRGVARLGCEQVELSDDFGLALLAACKGPQDVPIEHISGHAPTVADCALAMMRQAKSSLRVKVGGKKDAIEAASAPDEHGPCPPGELRLVNFELGSLNVAGLEVLLSLCAAQEGVTALHLGRNGLGPSHAVAIAQGASRLGSSSAVARLFLERNVLGSDGCVALCNALLPSSCSLIEELDLSRNNIGCEAATAICDLIRQNRLTRLVLTSNPLCGGSAANLQYEFGDENMRGRGSGGGGRAPPPPAFAAAAMASASAVGAANTPPTEEQKAAAKALASALSACISLRELHMRAIGLDASSGGALGEALNANRSLEALSLWKNSLGGKGGKALVQGLRMNATLTLLDLRSNQLDDEAGLALASHVATARGSKLAQLLVSDNQLGNESGKAMAKAWGDSSGTLWLLDVRGNKLDAAAIKELKSARGSAARKRAGREGAEPVELLADE